MRESSGISKGKYGWFLSIRGDAYGYTPVTASNTLDGVYVDGISITTGNPRKHVWTYAVGLSDNFNLFTVHNCPCARYPGPNLLLTLATITIVSLVTLECLIPVGYTTKTLCGMVMVAFLEIVAAICNSSSNCNCKKPTYIAFSLLLHCSQFKVVKLKLIR